MNPSAYVTIHRHQTTDRTRIRPVVIDDGSMPRVHLLMLTSTGEVDIALTADAAMQLGDTLHELAAQCADWWHPEKVEYQPRLQVVVE